MKILERNIQNQLQRPEVDGQTTTDFWTANVKGISRGCYHVQSSTPYRRPLVGDGWEGGFLESDIFLILKVPEAVLGFDPRTPER